MKPYVYLLHHLPTGYLYYGSKYAKSADPEQFWKTYFTSSVKVKELIRLYGADSFEYEIRRTFVDAISARHWEVKCIRRMKIVRNSRFLNQRNPGGIETFICRKNFVPWNKGKTGVQISPFRGKQRNYSDETISKLRTAARRENLSDETRRRKRESKLGTNNPCFGKIWINNGVAQKRILPGDLPIWLGWTKGKICNKDKTTGRFTIGN